MTDKIRVRMDGRLGGVYGPLTTPIARDDIADIMGWQDSGNATAVIDRAWALLQNGKAVRLTSHAGVNTIQPLTPDEDGRRIPASAATVYNPDGEIVEQMAPAV